MHVKIVYTTNASKVISYKNLHKKYISFACDKISTLSILNMQQVLRRGERDNKSKTLRVNINYNSKVLVMYKSNIEYEY